MIKQRPIELLAPAKNLECGIEAINHGADAVYIGAPRFGARAAAGNSIENIKALVEHAHLYNARIYVTVNTILHDEELPETEKMIWELYRAGVDALIIQDMGITRLNLPPIALHASTQMDNRTPEKVKFLSDIGFRQVVLARELSLDEIKKIHDTCPETLLEVFIHGALCVSYSGQCYVSQACYGRSANRGECAQFCRLAFDLVDSNGKTIEQNKHLLSLKDMNQSDNLEALLDAGATSLKIEGRLKDVSYVKNVTAYYRQKLDSIFKYRKEYVRASSGTVKTTFTPQLDKSFSRGFTDYFLRGRNPGIFSFSTPKSLGEEVGTVKEIRGNYFTVAGVKSFNNGDGLCYIDDNGRLQGFRVNRVENNKLFPQDMPRLKPKTRLYRNFDQEFEKLMQKKSAERKIAVDICLAENNFGFTLSFTDEDDNSVSLTLERVKEPARTPQADNLRNQLSKLGNTPFEAKDIKIDLSDNWFIPSSELSELRRNAVEKLLEARRINYRREVFRLKESKTKFPVSTLTYLGNVMNSSAAEFYKNHGVLKVMPAFEKEQPKDAVLMFCKHCIRYSMGWCPVHHKVRSPFREPYYLVSSDGRRFRLEFDCKQCQMKVLADNSEQ
ncbi:U32 family peptidase [Bacteroides sp. ET336]|uniref:peptidase U32 family protein n=1 Tax=Bacteroides sp. ET336 TaxID=2972459 RepID=UPI0021AC49E2|nr:U32 family peptidase [Bacteroides sp. ET336]MCR8894840.1 U32 family peptidase [Bacteroides sp. ET336]MDN0059336.1 U32 family peptidase [Bacteroides caecigallinarum]